MILLGLMLDISKWFGLWGGAATRAAREGRAGRLGPQRRTTSGGRAT
jgi:hypothetical protein